jgi:hypothetical protein
MTPNRPWGLHKQQTHAAPCETPARSHPHSEHHPHPTFQTDPPTAPLNFHLKKKKVLTENKTTQNRPKQHRARDETQKKEKKICQNQQG